MDQEVRNDIREQSNYSVMGCNVKTGKFLPRASQAQITCTYWGSKEKMLFGIGHPILHTTPSQIDLGLSTYHKFS